MFGFEGCGWAAVRHRSEGGRGKQADDRMMVTGSGDSCARRTRWCSAVVVATEVVVPWRRETEDNVDGGHYDHCRDSLELD
ncbi:hypothetical protein L1987_64809 [Smallanthus sonchifolius]|uniref:Uncharacterized protein n=1 Tax=Smallanthus sonchifolius TaxID=185202 RepID=A0ACB9BSP1_9ASTR|nr:hypothetical protein L1987_64809 [Smallanthus sonchifolius]